jgi:hypothetical protein
MPCFSLIERVARLLGPFTTDHGFSVPTGDNQANSSRGWVRLVSDEFLVDILLDRGEEWIEVGTKIRPGPRKPLRRWPLGHVVAYLDGAADPYPISDLENETGWLARRADEILDSKLINSEELRRWAVRASRRSFGQKPRR